MRNRYVLPADLVMFVVARAVEDLANAAVQGDRARIELGLRELIPSFSPTLNPAS